MLRFLALVLSLYSPRPDLNDAVRFWQRELYLQDWKVSVEVVSRAELADSTLGDIVPGRGDEDSRYPRAPRQRVQRPGAAGEVRAAADNRS